MELRKEYRDIANAYGHGLSTLARSQIELTALACQQLADRPPRELTDAEIDRVIVESVGMDTRSACRYLLQAHIAKQREPRVVKFRAARLKSDPAIVSVTHADAKLSEHWEWLEPAQEFEVRI